MPAVHVVSDTYPRHSAIDNSKTHHHCNHTGEDSFQEEQPEPSCVAPNTPHFEDSRRQERGDDASNIQS